MILETIFQNHPLWQRMKTLLQSGSKFPASPPNESDRKAAIQAAIQRGNHKGAIAHPEKLEKLVRTEVHFGWAMPLPIAIAHQIPGLIISPLNIVEQDTINEKGEIIKKLRLTHDHSFNHFPNLAINDRTDPEQLESCHFGKAMQRIIFATVHLRTAHPNKRIFIIKFDWKGAYRRIHFDPSTAVQCAVLLGQILLLALRLTFGGNVGPSEFCNASEMACDLSNAIIEDPAWDLQDESLFTPHQNNLPVPDRSKPEDEVTNTPPTCHTYLQYHQHSGDFLAKGDQYIDDQIVVAVDIDDIPERATASGPLALHALGRPLSADEPIPRDDLLSLSKFKAEATAEEKKKVLGLNLDTREMTLQLPSEKYKAWSHMIQGHLDEGSITPAQLESLIGRLQFAIWACPMGAHFMGRLRAKLDSKKKLAQKNQQHWFRKSQLQSGEREDLVIWKKLLKKACKGVSLFLLIPRTPNYLFRCDASTHGIGGYDNFGLAWRYEIPEKLRGRASINLLEFIGQVANLWIGIESKAVEPQSCIYSEGDNTASVSWLSKSNFGEEQSSHLKIARQYARLMMQHELTHTPEWIAGKVNEVADSLSRDFDISDTHLASALKSRFPQLPHNFRIVRPSTPITSWIASLLQPLPVVNESHRVPTRSGLWHGTDGTTTSDSPASNATPSSMASKANQSSTSLSPSRNPFETGDFRRNRISDWLATQSKLPSEHWQRPFWNPDDPIQDWTSTGNLPQFYDSSLRPSDKKTPKE
jgi:hypothetical protein